MEIPFTFVLLFSVHLLMVTVVAGIQVSGPAFEECGHLPWFSGSSDMWVKLELASSSAANVDMWHYGCHLGPTLTSSSAFLCFLLHVCQRQFVNREDSWSSSMFSRENNRVMHWQDLWTWLGKHSCVLQQRTAVKLTIRGRCWHFLTCLCRPPCIISYLRKSRAGLSVLPCDIPYHWFENRYC